MVISSSVFLVGAEVEDSVEAGVFEELRARLSFLVEEAAGLRAYQHVFGML